MHTAQEIYWTDYNVDIVNVLTFSSLSLKMIFNKYYDPKTSPIHILNTNEDTFIRRGYYVLWRTY